MTDKTAKARYEELANDRRPYLDRARQCAKLTIPSLLPDEGASGSTKFVTPEQGEGARGLNNISAKLLTALFPPNTSFFKMEVDAITAGELTQQEGMKDEVDAAFLQLTRKVQSDIEARALRSDLYEYFRLISLTGNATLFVPEEGRARVYRLDRYVVKRDAAGNMMEWIGLDTISRNALPDETRNAVPQAEKGQEDKDLELYTRVWMDDTGVYQVHQEVAEVVIKGTEGSYEQDVLPFIVGRYNKVAGESYGRGLIEEYLGDLMTLESLSKSVREFVAVASRIIPLVNPNATLTPRQLAAAQNGDVLRGNKEDVSFLQVERYNDFRVAKELIDGIKAALAFAFLMNTAIQRPGERVTAEEIRYMARELEDILGGVYSVQAVDLQLPLARVLMDQLARRGELPELPKNITTPRVVAGMDALGRGNDLTNLLQWKAVINDTPAAQEVKWSNFATRAANALNVETSGLIMTEEEKRAAHQQAMMMQAMQTLGPNAVNQGGQIIQKQMENPE
ncbi:portal protein [Paracoccus denitrificans]|uniref:portal protein n=1 Tax=Paracoccus denitrificans TaxID=266 RepID=UPI001E4EA139|nr:portal protein [Paracoccus denitrificans]UFS66949.1 portal protein [Paracoccus denitrificans]